MSRQALEPAQLVVELRAGRRVAVRQVEAADQHPVHRRLDVAAVGVVGIAGEAAAGLVRLGAARQDGDAVPALLALPDRAIAGGPDRRFRELLGRRLQLLQADHVGRRFLQPAQQHRQPAVDAVDVEGGDLHRPRRSGRNSARGDLAGVERGPCARSPCFILPSIAETRKLFRRVGGRNTATTFEVIDLMDRSGVAVPTGLPRSDCHLHCR